MLLAEFLFMLALPLPFMVFALREYSVTRLNMRLIFMLVTAFAFFIAAASLVMSENDVIAKSDYQWQRQVVRSSACYTDNVNERITCAASPYRSPNESTIRDARTDVHITEYLTPCDLGGDCIPTAYILAGVYGGMGLLFAVLAISEAFLLSMRSVTGAKY